MPLHEAFFTWCPFTIIAHVIWSSNGFFPPGDTLWGQEERETGESQWHLSSFWTSTYVSFVQTYHMAIPSCDHRKWPCHPSSLYVDSRQRRRGLGMEVLGWPLSGISHIWQNIFFKVLWYFNYILLLFFLNGNTFIIIIILSLKAIKLVLKIQTIWPSWVSRNLIPWDKLMSSLIYISFQTFSYSYKYF